MKKGANLCGIGTDNIIYIKVDENRRMIPSELAKVIEDQKNQGNDILLVNSTVGTTVEGSIDPVKEIG
jgi:glutamate decarboxylase